MAMLWAFTLLPARPFTGVPTLQCATCSRDSGSRGHAGTGGRAAAVTATVMRAAAVVAATAAAVAVDAAAATTSSSCSNSSPVARAAACRSVAAPSTVLCQSCVKSTAQAIPVLEARPKAEFCLAEPVQSVLQVVVQGLPWAYTQEQLSPMFQQFGNIVSAEVVYGRDGRSRVSSCCPLERAR